MSSDRSARAGHGRGDGRAVARRLPAPERPQNPRAPCTGGSGHAGRAPCRRRSLERARRGGVGAPENVAGNGWVPQTGRARVMPGSPAPPDAGIDAETAARLKKFGRLMKQRSAPETETMHWTAINGEKALGLILKEMLETAPCDPMELRKKMNIGCGTYDAAQKRGRDHGLLERHNGKVALTRAGKMHALALRLGLSMAEMCVVSNVYVTWMALEGFALRFYSKDINTTIRLGICDKYMDKIYRGLVKKGCAQRENPKSKGQKVRGALYMDGGLFARLHQYMEDLVWVQNSKWTYGKLRPAGLSLRTQLLIQHYAHDQEWQESVARSRGRRNAEKASMSQSDRAPARDSSPPADPRT